MLAAIPSSLDLADATDAHINRTSSAWALWNLVDDLHGVGSTLTSKLLARKRPRLMPVQDSVVSRAIGLTSGGNMWTGLRELLRADEAALAATLRAIRNEAPVAASLTDLRVFDIVVWMAEHR